MADPQGCIISEEKHTVKSRHSEDTDLLLLSSSPGARPGLSVVKWSRKGWSVREDRSPAQESF